MEGSKELDFSAAMEADVDSTTADADNNVAGSSGLKKSGSSSSLGNKRSLTKDVPVKEEEIGGNSDLYFDFFFLGHSFKCHYANVPSRRFGSRDCSRD